MGWQDKSGLPGKFNPEWVAGFNRIFQSAAEFGTSLAVLFNISIAKGGFLLIGNSFIFGLIPTFVIIAIANYKKASKETFILTGIAISFLFSSASSALKYFSDAENVYSLAYIVSGNLARATWGKDLILLITAVPFFIFIFFLSNDLNIMNTGDNSARSLGINPELLRILLLVIVTIVVVFVTSLFGVISFIGLVAPHIGRILVGNDHNKLIIAAGYVGMILLLVSDIIANNIIKPVILPIGIVTSGIGAPFFIYLILNRKKEIW